MIMMQGAGQPSTPGAELPDRESEHGAESALEYLVRADPVLAAIIARIGPCRIAARAPTFETLARSIVFQQLHGKAALSIFNKVKTAVDGRFTPSRFLQVSTADLRGCGLSRQKIASLTDLAERVQRREIRFRNIHQLGDEAIVSMFSQARGVGVWTAQMFLMFALQRPNVLPLGDFGIRNAVRKAYGLEKMPTPAELQQVAQTWHPYCTTACWYLWRSLDGAAQL